jgi:Glycosyl transferases group 1
MRKLTIGLLGNHDAPDSTESELAWTLDHLGHKVLRFQEDRDTTERVYKTCKHSGARLLIYVHTHGWETPGVMSIGRMLEKLRRRNIKTASFHLDLYWGLNQNDRRQDRVGDHAFWKTDRVFTADGGHEEGFAARGVRHHWLPAGIVERDCVRGTPRQDLSADVAFVGARDYHPEYPFRGELIRWLETTYGERFRRFNGDTTGIVRGSRLNDLYASVKVVVGDSCFAGIPRYWSDRVPETLGRGGFLLHPAVEGLTIPGLVTYRPRDLDDLRAKIDHYLPREAERRAASDLAFAAVGQQHTYTKRMQELLRVMGV